MSINRCSLNVVKSQDVTVAGKLPTISTDSRPITGMLTEPMTAGLLCHQRTVKKERMREKRGEVSLLFRRQIRGRCDCSVSTRLITLGVTRS